MHRKGRSHRVVGGGPHHRATSGAGFDTQIFATRGYAVFQPNFRGSTGYGKKFLDALLALAEAPRCRRQTLLAYFGAASTLSAFAVSASHDTPSANALNVGATKDEIVELMVQLFTYVGTPKAVTGFRAGWVVLDDPIKNREIAESPAAQEALYNEFVASWASRQTPPGCAVIVMTHPPFFRMCR